MFFGQHPDGGGVKLFPGIGKRKLGFPVKEGDPVVILQPLDMLGEVLLGDIKLWAVLVKWSSLASSTK